VHTLTCLSFITKVDGSLYKEHVEYFNDHKWFLLHDSGVGRLHDIYYEFYNHSCSLYLLQPVAIISYSYALSFNINIIELRDI